MLLVSSITDTYSRVDTVLWTMRLVTVGLVLGLAVLLYQWYDVPLPPEMEEKWKIRVVEAIMRISGYIVSFVFKKYALYTELKLHLCLNYPERTQGNTDLLCI